MSAAARSSARQCRHCRARCRYWTRRLASHTALKVGIASGVQAEGLAGARRIRRRIPHPYSPINTGLDRPGQPVPMRLTLVLSACRPGVGTFSGQAHPTTAGNGAGSCLVDQLSSGTARPKTILSPLPETTTRLRSSIIRTHNRMLFRMARSILASDDEAEDAVQAAYVRAFTGILRVPQGGAARHLAAPHCHQRGARPRTARAANPVHRRDRDAARRGGHSVPDGQCLAGPGTTHGAISDTADPGAGD